MPTFHSALLLMKPQQDIPLSMNCHHEREFDNYKACGSLKCPFNASHLMHGLNSALLHIFVIDLSIFLNRFFNMLLRY